MLYKIAVFMSSRFLLGLKNQSNSIRKRRSHENEVKFWPRPKQEPIARYDNKISTVERLIDLSDIFLRYSDFSFKSMKKIEIE